MCGDQKVSREQGMKMFVRVELSEEPNNGFIERPENLGSVLDMLRECPPGEGYILRRVDLTETAYNSLPEFVGF